MDREPNSVRFWRLNSLEAFRTANRQEYEAESPEQLAAIRAEITERRKLEERENAVQARAERMARRRIDTAARPNPS